MFLREQYNNELLQAFANELQTDALGNSTTYQYSAGVLLTTITDARCNVTVNRSRKHARTTRPT